MDMKVITILTSFLRLDEELHFHYQLSSGSDEIVACSYLLCCQNLWLVTVTVANHFSNMHDLCVF
jgi:hypothetical protein